MSLAFSYANLMCSGATPRRPSGKFSYSTDGARFEFASDVMLISSGASGLAWECARFEAAMKTWDQPLLVTLDGATFITHAPATNTGLLLRPKAEKPGSAEDSERSRKYRVTIQGRLPASAAGKAGGWVEGKIQVEIDTAGRPTVTFRGSYSAEGGSTARTKFADGATGATAQATAWLNAFGVASEFEKLSEDTIEDADSKLLDYTQVWRKRLIPETEAGAASAAYRIDSLILARDVGGHRDTVARFTLNLAATVHQPTTDYTALQALWRDTIKPALTTQLSRVWLNASDVPRFGEPVIEQEDVAFDTANSTIRATLKVFAPVGSLVSLAVTQRIQRLSRFEPKKLWDGEPHTYLLYALGTMCKAEVTATVESLGAWRIEPRDFAPHKPDGAGSATWVLLEQSTEESEATVGHHQSAALTVRRSVHRFEFLLAADPLTVVPGAVIA